MAHRTALTTRHRTGNVKGVTRLELSVSEPHVVRQRLESPLDRWAMAVTGAREPCLLLDAEAVIVAISEPVTRLLRVTGPVLGRDVLAAVLHLVDFADGQALTEDEVTKIPPILAITSGRLARGLLRVGSSDTVVTLDAIATPLLDGETVAGSLTFFSPV